MNILLVEDHVELGTLLQRRLTKAGHRIEWVTKGAQAIRYAVNGQWDVILLDIMLPDKSGFDVLNTLRQQGLTTPVLALTARTEIDDKVSMLDLGADDYMVKPFDFRELEARLRALQRRPMGQAATTYPVGPLSVDSKARRISYNDVVMDFGQREFCLLELLLGRLGHAVSKERLLMQLYNFDEQASYNAVELHISRLRRKLPPLPIHIETIRSVGYSAQLIPETDTAA